MAEAFQQLLTIHREDFPPAQRPVAPAPALPITAEVRQRHEKAALTGIGLFKRTERTAAKKLAATAAEDELESAVRTAKQTQQAQQHELDVMWTDLQANEPDTVMAVLAEAFGDNEAAAVPVGVSDGEVTLVVLVPDESVVPERMPTVTSAGNLSLRKLTKTDRSNHYNEAVLGHVLVTLRETFAVAPALTAARLVALRPSGSDAYGKPRVEALLAGRWTRSAFEGVRWSEVGAARIAQDTTDDLVVNAKAGQLRVLDLDKQPELADLLSRVDVEDLIN